MKNQILKDYYKKINSFNEIKEGDIVLISDGFSLFKQKSSDGLKKGIVVKKINKKSLFTKSKCIIYNVNTLNYPNEELICKILNYYKLNADEILKGEFEYIHKFSKGEPIYIVKKRNEAHKKETT